MSLRHKRDGVSNTFDLSSTSSGELCCRPAGTMGLVLRGFRPATNVSVGTMNQEGTRWRPRVIVAGIVTEIPLTNVVEVGDSVFLNTEI